MLMEIKLNLLQTTLPVLLLAVPSFANAQSSLSAVEADNGQKSTPVDSASDLRDSGGHVVGTGDPAPDFTLPSLNGTKATLSSYSNKTVVLWFTNLCSGCQSVLPQVGDIGIRYADRGVSVIAISLLGDDTTTVRKIAKEYTVPFTFLIDPKASVYENYGGTEIPPGTCPVNPQFFVVNQGIITYATHFPGASRNEIRAEVEKAIALAGLKDTTGSASEHPADKSEHPRDTIER